jgi:phosphoserine phosphatase
MPTRFASVWFDCDSTLSAVEGIDELAALRGGRAAAASVRLTQQAMDGALPLEAVYGERLRLIAPTRDEVAALGARYVEQAVPGAREVVARLAGQGIAVGVVSGGLRPAVLALTRWLGIDDARVHAVDVRFGDGGEFIDFDRCSPLARAGGKREILAALPPGDRPAALVGDGATDLEAAPAVDLFVGFGGVARRPAVERGAARFIAERDLRPLLGILGA